MFSKDLKTLIPKLLERLDAHPKSIVVLNVSNETPKDQVKVIIESVLSTINDGTLCVIGDCGFNTHQSNIENLMSLNKKERMLLSSNYALQLLSLRHDCHLSEHPSLSIGCVGHYARYLTRHQAFDFPYGAGSIFEDLVTLNAIYLSIGNVEMPYALKHAYHKDKAVVIRNVCVYEDEPFAYLDFMANFNKLQDLQETLCLSESSQLMIYGEKYPWLIDQIHKRL